MSLEHSVESESEEVLKKTKTKTKTKTKYECMANGQRSQCERTPKVGTI